MSGELMMTVKSQHNHVRLQVFVCLEEAQPEAKHLTSSFPVPVMFKTFCDVPCLCCPSYLPTEIPGFQMIPKGV